MKRFESATRGTYSEDDMATPNTRIPTGTQGDNVHRPTFKQWLERHPEVDLERYDGRSYEEWVVTYTDALTAYVEDMVR